MAFEREQREPQSGETEGFDLGAEFDAMWRGDGDPATATVDLLPTRLAKACAALLPVDGAGLSLHQTEFRVPIGASDEMATLAERLQFTQGEGPCLESAEMRRTLVVGADDMEAMWPSFAAELFQHTPYQGITSLPVALTPGLFAALDLYFVDPESMNALRVADTAAITARIAEALAARTDSLDDAASNDSVDDEEEWHVPSWLDNEPTRKRTYVWVAVGMVMTEFRLTTTDAVALLRSYAYGRDQTLDDVAMQLVKGDIDVAQIQP